MGHSVHSLKGVTMQSLLQGSRQGRTDSGRGASGHLRQQTHSDLLPGHSVQENVTRMLFDHRKQVDEELRNTLRSLCRTFTKDPNV